MRNPVAGKMSKISIIGAGNVGATTAFLLLVKNLADVVMVDLSDSVIGKALDMAQSKPILGFKNSITGTTDYRMIKGSDIVIITAGVARKPGMTREDLLDTNLGIIKGVCEQVKKYASDSIVISVTNPLDLIAYTALKVTGFPRERVIGMAGTLDTARFRVFLGEAAGTNVQAIVLGSHGDDMAPLIDHVEISGKEKLEREKILEAANRTRNAGAELVNYLKSGSAYYAAAAAIVEVVEAILNKESKALPVSVFLKGEYGYEGFFLGVPAKLGRAGVKEIIELELSSAEREMLDKSASSIRQKTIELEKRLANS